MKIIETKRGQKIKVDNADYRLLNDGPWHIASGYACRKNGKAVYMHRRIMQPKPGEYVDHINGDKLDNRRSNLRICTQSQNLANSSIRQDNKTGYKGVHITNRSSSVEASIQFRGKPIYIGRFKTALEAARAYDKKAIELFGEFAKTNLKEII